MNERMPNLLQLAHRLKTDRTFLKKHPEHKEMLETKIARDTEAIVNCVLRNSDSDRGRTILEALF